MANETAANKATQDYADYVTQKETEFRQLQGTQAVDAFPAFQKDLEDRFQQTAGTLQSPMAQLAFQRDGRSFYQRTMYGAGLYTGDQAKRANDESWNGNIQLAINQAVLHHDQPDALQDAVSKTIDNSLILAHGEGMSQDAADALVSKKLGDLYRDVAMAKIAGGDTDGAAKLLDDARSQIIPGTGRPLLDADHLAQISQTIANRQYTDSQRQLAQDRREEEQAARELRQTQTVNEAQIFADTVAGKPHDSGRLVEMLRTQQITPAGYNAVIGLAGRESKGDPVAEAHLWEQINSHTATADDVYSGMEGHRIGGTIGIEMVKALSTEKHTSNPVEQKNFGTLRTAVGLDATEHPLIDLDKTSQQAQAALWATAQQEWTQRVLVNGENSSAVLQDMLPRFAHPPTTPAAWPKPRMGAVTTSADAIAVAQRTEQAFKAGQINQAQYDGERRLILQYKNYYDAQTKRQTAVKAGTTGVPASQRAKPLGVTGAAP